MTDQITMDKYIKKPLSVCLDCWKEYYGTVLDNCPNCGSGHKASKKIYEENKEEMGWGND